MFKTTRLKLTIWYLIIILLITSLFSIAFFHTSTREFRRIVEHIQMKQEEDWENRKQYVPPGPPPNEPSIEELENSTQRLLINLVLTNGMILVLSGIAAYFLSGKTLKPIKIMVDEQNEFITNSSHELRTPLSTLRAEMESNLLEKHISDKQARNILNSNLEEVGRLQNLANKLLQLSKLNDQETRYEEHLSLKKLIATTVKQLQPLAKSKQIKINFEMDEAFVRGEQSSLQELFIILIENAIKYSPQKSEIDISANATSKTVSIAVKDQGIGISDEDLKHIFTRFYRSDKSRKTDGFGLGLAIAKKIATKHGGNIKVLSKLNAGSTFTVSIPLEKS